MQARNPFCLPFSGIGAAAALLLAVPGQVRAQAPAEAVATWSVYAHALSYQGRTLTRDSSGNYFAILRRGSSVRVYRRTAATGTWSDLGAVNPTPLSGREGDCCAIAVDGLNRIHMVLYDGASPNLVHRVSANGTSISPATTIAAGVTWNTTADGGPFLHVGLRNDLHVAYVDDAGELPYYARSTDGGATWSRTRVVDYAPGNIRPSVVSLPGGRLIYAFSGPHVRTFVSDDQGSTWTEASPSAAGASTVANIRLAANGDRVFVTGQKLAPAPRSIVVNECDGTTMAWTGWRQLEPGTGADASLYLDAAGRKNIVWRRYPDQPNSVYRSLDSGGTFARSTVSQDGNYILPFAYWQEYHRWNPSDNAPALLAPDRGNSTLYFIRLTGNYLADAGAPNTPPPPPPPDPPPGSPTEPESVSTWTGFNHPLGYTGRSLTRDPEGNYFVVMRIGNDVHVLRRNRSAGTWTDAGIMNATALSGREGDCCAIAADGLGRIHVVYYDGPAPDLMHRVSADGLSFGPASVIRTSVTWNTTADGGPFLHVGRNGDLHVAFVDEAEELPWYARSTDGGATWSRSRVASYAPGNIRPSVISLPGGRIIFGFSAPHFRAFRSDDNGATWTEASPVSAEARSLPNARLAGDGNRVYVTGQRLDPQPRAIVLNECDGTDMAWTGWRTVHSGSGADASLFIDDQGRRNILWRAYPDAPNSVWRSVDSGAGFSRRKITQDNFYYIMPVAYWQEYHRWNPPGNEPAILAPRYSDRTLYFFHMNGAYKPDEPDAESSPPRAASGLLPAPAPRALRMPTGAPAYRYRLDFFDLSGRHLGALPDPLASPVTGP